MLSKEKVRRKFALIRKRKSFPVDKNYFKPLIRLINRKKKKNLSLYYPSNYEVDTIKLFEVLEGAGRFSTSLPIISHNGTMQFVKWKLHDPLQVNSYGFLEPTKQKKTIFPDLFVVPLLAYDKFHNRLGYGKGYYDRFLKKHAKKKKNVLTIGLAFSFQKYKKIPTSKHDIKLDYILTEKGIF
tara:strand:- start:175 stop:723 length:549 start_codon:yes stop_codon:yes gene_type:complete